MSSSFYQNQEYKIVSVAVPVPLRQHFDFIFPNGFSPLLDDLSKPVIGLRVKVSFGRRNLIGVIIDVKDHSDYPVEKLKPILEVLETESLFDPSLWKTVLWISRYYLAPIGEVLDGAMPVLLRQGSSVTPSPVKYWTLTDYARGANPDELNRAPLQLAIIKKFMHRLLSYA